MGSYRLIQRIAAGGMAEVFLAKAIGAQGFEKPVAVKRVLPHLAEDPRFVALFLREARLTVSLQHANVVQVLDLGASGGQYYMVLEFVDGENLRTLLRAAAARGLQVGLREALHVVQQVGEGLAHAHARTDAQGRPLNLVHRDVNPSNVMVSHAGEVKLADFGIAKGEDFASASQVGVVKGKTGYLAPEQAEGRPADQRSDLFLLGQLLYELLCGRALFQGLAFYDFLEALRRFDPAALALPAHVPPPVQAVLVRALARDPAARYQRARDLCDALQHALLDLRLKVGPPEVAALFARLLPERVSPLAQDVPAAGAEEIRLDTELAPPAAPARRARRRLGEVLVERGLVSVEGLRRALERQRREGGKLGAHLVAAGALAEDDLVRTVAEQHGLQFVGEARLRTLPLPDADVLGRLPHAHALRLRVVPLALHMGELAYATSEPHHPRKADEVRRLAGVDAVRPVLAGEGALARALQRFYPAGGREDAQGPWEGAAQAWAGLLARALTALGGPAQHAAGLGRLTERVARRLGASAPEADGAAAAGAALLLAARLSGGSARPTLAALHAVLGQEAGALAALAGPCCADAPAPPASRGAVALACALAFLEAAGGTAPSPARAARALAELRGRPGLPPTGVDALAAAVAELPPAALSPP